MAATFAIKLALSLVAVASHVSLGAHLDETDDSVLANDPNSSHIKYLRDYGYLSEGGAERDSFSAEAVAAAIKQFQKFIGLEATGQLTSQTREWIQRPRCGNADIPVPRSRLAELRLGSDTDPYELTEPTGEASDEGRQRRHLAAAQHGPGKWANKTISYRLANRPSLSSMSAGEVEAEIERAFEAWAQAASLSFEKREAPGKVDIEVSFVRDRADLHDNAVGRASEPGWGEGGPSQVLLDDGQKWSADGADNTRRLLSVALHELGHTLGLSHSHLTESAMFPLVRDDLGELSREDKGAVEAIYMAPKQSELRELNAICNRHPFIYEYFSPGPNFRTYYSCTRLGPVLRYCQPGLAWHRQHGYCDYAFTIPGFHYF